LKNANSLLDDCQQPYQYLIESIRRRDEEISRLRQTMHSLDAQLRYQALFSLSLSYLLLCESKKNRILYSCS